MSDLEKLLKEAFVSGYRQAIYDYAVWKDGKMVIGCGTHSLKESIDNAEADCRDYFSEWCESWESEIASLEAQNILSKSQVARLNAQTKD